MSNIKGLYFKLNMDNPRDKAIYDFFSKVPESTKVDKITLLHCLIYMYCKLRSNEEYGMMYQDDEK